MLSLKMNQMILREALKVCFCYFAAKNHPINVLFFFYFDQFIPISTQNQRLIHASAVCLKTSAGKYKITVKKDRPLTYEMANPPQYIVARKAWNSWNCCKSNFFLCDIHIKTVERHLHCDFIQIHCSKSTRRFAAIPNSSRRFIYSEIYHGNISFSRVQ